MRDAVAVQQQPPRSSSSSSSGTSPCAGCKLLRRRCTKDCIFAPYFPAEEPLMFACVHKVFGASNVNKMLQDLPEHQRVDAVSSMVYEANARLRDPVYGCVGVISFLQHQVAQLQNQLALAQAEVLRLQMFPAAATAHLNVGNGFSMDTDSVATSTTSSHVFIHDDLQKRKSLIMSQEAIQQNVSNGGGAISIS